MDRYETDAFFTELQKISSEMSKEARSVSGAFGHVARAKAQVSRVSKKLYAKTPKSVYYGAAGGLLAADSAHSAEKRERLADERAKLSPEESKALRKKRLKKLTIPKIIAGASLGAAAPSVGRAAAKVTNQVLKRKMPEVGKDFGKGVPAGIAEAVSDWTKAKFKRK
jgi:hypothetical protein